MQQTHYIFAWKNFDVHNLKIRAFPPRVHCRNFVDLSDKGKQWFNELGKNREKF